MADDLVAQARAYLDLYMPTSAAYLLEKATMADPGHRKAVELLADCYRQLGWKHRALALLQSRGWRALTPGARVLCARVLLDLGKNEECIEFVQENLQDADEALRASLLCVRGYALEALDNRAGAANAFANALRSDIRCVEAFRHMLDSQLVCPPMVNELVAQSDVRSDCAWLRDELLAESGDPTASVGRADDLAADSVAAMANSFCDLGQYVQAERMASLALRKEPSNLRALPPLVACLFSREAKSELFSLVHRIVADHPGTALAWYAVGCYYLLLRNFEPARRALARSTAADPAFCYAWIAFGHAFAYGDETDQALAAYRTASRLFPGSSVAMLSMGVEHLRANNVPLALQHLEAALAIVPRDPFVWHERGVIEYQSGQLPTAVECFKKALAYARGDKEPSASQDYLNSRAWEPTVFMMGHALRKLGNYAEATTCYEQCLLLRPRDASVYAALGFCAHLQGRFSNAITMYHKALSISAESTFTKEMLERALEDEALEASAQL